MPAYTLARNVKTQRVSAYESLAIIFQHLEAFGVDLTAVSIAATGGTAGRVTLTTTQAIPADQLTHLGLQ